jgi:hypothetical protein
MVRRVFFHWRARMSPSPPRLGASLGKDTLLGEGALGANAEEGTSDHDEASAPAAEAKFVICEQSIDTNHGYAQRQVENS